MDGSDIIKLTHEEITAARLSPSEATAAPKFPVTVLLENIRSLYNVGSIFRTSDGASIEKLYLCGYTGYPPRKEIDKTALGSVDCVNWEHSPDTARVIHSLRERGYEIICLEHTDRSETFDRVSYSRPLCLVLGNEVEGVTRETLSLCDRAVEIPMHGAKQSLNVAVAYGIAVYQIIRNSEICGNRP